MGVIGIAVLVWMVLFIGLVLLQARKTGRSGDHGASFHSDGAWESSHGHHHPHSDSGSHHGGHESGGSGDSGGGDSGGGDGGGD